LLSKTPSMQRESLIGLVAKVVNARFQCILQRRIKVEKSL